MPRGDRTGPDGMGPRTGRGLGYCNGYEGPGFSAGSPGGGRGFGRGFGRGRGFRGRSFFPEPAYPQRLTKEEEKKMLEDEKNMIEKELNDIKKRLEEIVKE